MSALSLARSAHPRPASELWHVAAGLAAVAAVTAAYVGPLHVSNPTVASLSFVLIVLLASATSSLRVAVSVSLLAVPALNFYFMPPVGTFHLDDPLNWVALVAFLTVSVVGSRMSLAARSRAVEALARQDELGRLFDLSRDILLTTDSREAVDELARHMARRFGFAYVGVCLPVREGWEVHGSSDAVALDHAELDQALAAARGTLEFDARTRSYGGHRTCASQGGLVVTLVPLRLGMRAVGLLAAAGRPVETGTLDAIAGLAAIAIERAKMLEERQDSERLRQGAELKSALLASLSHDLKTPLTAITVAAGNLRAAGTSDELKRDQLDVIGVEVNRLNRLFQNIVDMARIETGAVNAEREWVHPADIVDAAIRQVEDAVAHHPLELDVDTSGSAQVDPRLTSAALAHLLENAGQYTPAGTPITLAARVDDAGLTMSVRDHGPGIAPQEVEYLFDRFFRGSGAQRRSFGTGMGLAITRGLLAAQGGRAWAENHPDGGAVFTMLIPTSVREGRNIDGDAS